MSDGILFILVVLNLAVSAGLVFFYRALRRRDASALQKARREGERNLQETVDLCEQMYKILSKEIQELRQEIDGLSVPAVIPTSNNRLDKRFHVLSLAARGLGLDEIVEKADIPKGEAELILRLNRLKNAKETRNEE